MTQAEIQHLIDTGQAKKALTALQAYRPTETELPWLKIETGWAFNYLKKYDLATQSLLLGLTLETDRTELRARGLHVLGMCQLAQHHFGPAEKSLEAGMLIESELVRFAPMAFGLIRLTELYIKTHQLPKAHKTLLSAEDYFNQAIPNHPGYLNHVHFTWMLLDTARRNYLGVITHFVRAGLYSLRAIGAAASLNHLRQKLS